MYPRLIPFEILFRESQLFYRLFVLFRCAITEPYECIHDREAALDIQIKGNLSFN